MRLKIGAAGLFAFAISIAASQSTAKHVDVPRFWNDRELSDWALPVAGLNVRPGHYTEQEYYAAPEEEWVRTYPLYAPGHEPPGYWDTIRNAKPEPLLTSGARSEAEWIRAGARVFHELDIVALRNYEPEVHQILRSPEEFQKRGGHMLKDGTVPMLRWAPTSKGLAVTQQHCASCHTRVLPDGSVLDGAPSNADFDNFVGALMTPRQVRALMSVAAPGDTYGMFQWRQYGVPWVPNDINERVKSFGPGDRRKFGMPINVVARFNGSPFYPTKIPDLIGIRDRKFIDHTATHRLRGVADLMRYAEEIECCDIADFGPYRMLSDTSRRVVGRTSDHVLFALAEYLFSLRPPAANPHLEDPRAAAGKNVFEREGCGSCHTPPLYTNNKLTLATGYTPPADHPSRADIMLVSVGTDPGLALQTRKGTGLYKVPSLRGVWYRGGFDHDGSVTALEEWFDPARLRDDYVPSGFKGYELTHRAVPGHPFGLNLGAADKAALLAFLRTL